MISKRIAVFGSIALLTLAGCGGRGSLGGSATGGTTGNAGGGSLGGQQVSNSTAEFHVDVNSGKVTITPLNTSSSLAPAVFRGDMIGFNSSLLVDEPGDTGRKVLTVSLTNNTGEAIGSIVSPQALGQTSLSVLFSAITQTTALTSVEPLIKVSTKAGTTSGYANGTLAAAKFKNPTSVAFNPSDGSIWVTDFGNNVIRRIGSSGVTTIAGSGSSVETDGSGAAASFKGPYGIAYNPSDGSFAVTDNGGNKVRRVTPAGVVTTIAGTGATGTTMGLGSSATMTGPSGVTVSPTGVIYVSGLDNIIRQISLSGANPRLASNYTVGILAGNSSGTAGSADGVAAAASFSDPRGLALDPTGNLYVADTGNEKIRLVSPTGEVVSIAGTGATGDVNGTGNVAEFNNLSGLSYANGILAASDYVGNYIRYLWLSPGASPASPLNWNVANAAGTGAAGSVNGSGSASTFNGPFYMCADTSGNFYVAEYSNSLVREISPVSGSFTVGTLGGTTATSPVVLGNPTATIPNSVYGALMPYIAYTVPGTLAPSASTNALQWEFVVPTGVTSFDFQVSVEADTTTLAQPGAAVGAGSPTVDVRTFAGAVGAAGGYINGGLTDARFSTAVNQLAMDGLGNIYLADTENDAVRIIMPQSVSGATMSQGVVGTVAGTVANVGGTYASGTGLSATFSEPSGVAVTPDGLNIYVADSDNAVLRVIQTSQPSTDPSQYSVFTIAGSPGSTGNQGGLGTVALFQLPFNLAMSPTGDLYMTDMGNNCVYRIQFLGGSRAVASNYYVTTFASGFNGPSGIACDISGNVYVADQFNGQIKKITPSGSVSVLAGSGTYGYADGAATTAKFADPSGIAVDSAGYVYVTDTDNAVIRRVAPNGYTETVCGTTTRGDVDGPGNTALLSNPLGVCMNPAGTIYFDDGRFTADTKAHGVKQPTASGFGTSDSIRMVQAVLTNNSPAGSARK